MAETGKTSNESEKALRALSVAMFLGLLSIPVYALQGWPNSSFLSVLSVGSMLSGSLVVPEPPELSPSGCHPDGRARRLNAVAILLSAERT